MLYAQKMHLALAWRLLLRHGLWRGPLRTPTSSLTFSTIYHTVCSNPPSCMCLVRKDVAVGWHCSAASCLRSEVA